MKSACSGVILAGGLNKRFSGANKALLRIDGKMIFDYVYEAFDDLFEEIILVTNDPLPFLKWDIRIVTDIFQIRSPLIGIHAGLFYSAKPHAFITACDTPFLKKELIEAVIEEFSANCDIVIPETSDGLQPLCAAYSKRCLNVLAAHLAQQEEKPNNPKFMQQGLKIQRLFEKFRVKKLDEKKLREKDPELKSFFNVNTPDDLARAGEMTR